jgi:hypothetical protein
MQRPHKTKQHKKEVSPKTVAVVEGPRHYVPSTEGNQSRLPETTPPNVMLAQILHARSLRKQLINLIAYAQLLHTRHNDLHIRVPVSSNLRIGKFRSGTGAGSSDLPVLNLGVMDTVVAVRVRITIGVRIRISSQRAHACIQVRGSRNTCRRASGGFEVAARKLFLDAGEDLEGSCVLDFFGVDSLARAGDAGLGVEDAGFED